MKSPLLKRIIATIALLTLICVLGIAAGINSINTAPVTNVRASYADVETSLWGCIEAIGVSDVVAPEDVYIDSLNVEKGMHLSSGDPIVSLVDVEANRQLMAAMQRLDELNLETEAIQAVTAMQSERMAQALKAESALYDIIAKAQTEGAEYEKYNAAVENAVSCWAVLASAQLNQERAFDEAELEALQLEVHKLQQSARPYELVAPYSGIVLEVNASSGSSAKQGDVLLKIAEKLQVVAKGGSEKLDLVKAGDSALIIDKANSVTSEVTDVVRSNIGTTIVLDAAAASTYGSDVKIVVFSQGVQRTLLVPFESVLYDADGAYVYVLENGTMNKRTVTTGEKISKDIEIFSGLNEGDTIISAPARLPFEAIYKAWCDLKQKLA